MEEYLNVEILEQNKLIDDRKNGFHYRKSTADLLSTMTLSWKIYLEFCCESEIVALDFSKALDQVWPFWTNNQHSVFLQPIPYQCKCSTRISACSNVISPSYKRHFVMNRHYYPIHNYAYDSALHSAFFSNNRVGSPPQSCARISLAILEKIRKWGA